MTNTLHRYGNADSFRDDYVVFATVCKGKNDSGALKKMKHFLSICLKHRPVNVGGSAGSAYRPSTGLQPTVHWKRDTAADLEGVIEGVTEPGTAAAVFDSMERAVACLQDVIEADLGLSVNVSTSVDGAKEVANQCDRSRHSVEYSLGFMDPHDRLPDRQVLELSTMCGHGMVSANLAKKMIEMVREGRRTPDQAVATLARFCPCGVYNPERARRLLQIAHTGRD